MTIIDQRFAATLRQHNQKVTPARRAIFDALRVNGAVSMAELVRYVGLDADKASIYRTVALFESLGMVQRLPFGWKYKLELTDAYSHHHHHLSCVSCGRIVEFQENTALAHNITAAAKHNGFRPLEHQLEIQGYCHMCQSD